MAEICGFLHVHPPSVCHTKDQVIPSTFSLFFFLSGIYEIRNKYNGSPRYKHARCQDKIKNKNSQKYFHVLLLSYILIFKIMPLICVFYSGLSSAKFHYVALIQHSLPWALHQQQHNYYSHTLTMDAGVIETPSIRKPA